MASGQGLTPLRTNRAQLIPVAGKCGCPAWGSPPLEIRPRGSLPPKTTYSGDLPPRGRHILEIRPIAVCSVRDKGIQKQGEYAGTNLWHSLGWWKRERSSPKNFSHYYDGLTDLKGNGRCNCSFSRRSFLKSLWKNIIRIRLRVLKLSKIIVDSIDE